MVDEKVLEELCASVDGDTGFVRDLIEAYLADSAGQLDAIRDALATNDAEALVRPAHTLKSSSATVGALELSTQARTLEMAAKAGSLGDGDALAAADALAPTFQATTAELRAWVAGATGG